MTEAPMKQKIFLTAARLFGEQGYSKVSMRDIAGEVGIQAASIYNHYPSKEQLLEEIIQHYVDMVEAFFGETERRMRAPGYQPRLTDVVYIYPEDEPELMRSITRLLYSEQFSSPLAADTLIGEGYRDYSRGPRLFFEALYERSVVGTRARAEQYATMFSRMGHAYQLAWTHPAQGYDVDLYAMYKRMLKLILCFEGTTNAYESITGEPYAPD